MENNFTNTAERIDARRLAITEALEREATAISEAEPMLLEHYKKSVKSVMVGLINNTEVQGRELFKDLKKSNDNLLKSFIKSRNLLLRVFLPTALLIGVTIGILGMLYFYKPQIMIDPSRIVKSEDGTPFYPINDLRIYQNTTEEN